MDENTKLYVFSRKEVALIFLFLLLVALTSFVLGVRVGKDFAFKNSTLKQSDREEVELLSGQEEKVNKVVKEVKEDIEKPLDQEMIKERLETLIKEETNKTAEERKEQIKAQNKANEEQNAVVEEKKEEVKVEEEKEPLSTDNEQNVYSGKYTIQLGSHQNIEDAKAFAEGFRVRGYNPIINEVELPNRGVWYRVSLGTFDSVTDAKNYVKKEESLFQGQDYHFAKFE